MAKKKDRGKYFEDYTVDDMVGFISKWASIPFGLWVVLVAGSVLNLTSFHSNLSVELTPVQQEFIRWGVMGAYYGGILAGPVVDLIKYRYSFLYAAIISVFGFVALSFYTDSESVGALDTFLITVLLISVSFSASIASIAAVTIVIKNFTEKRGPMVVAVMLTYYLIASLFDQCFRKGYFTDVELKKNLISSGIIQFFIYVWAAFILKKPKSSTSMRKVSKYIDMVGLLIFAALEILFTVAIFVVWVVEESWRFGVIIMILMILINFVLVGLVIQLLLKRMESEVAKGYKTRKSTAKESLHRILLILDYVSLLVGTFIVVGSGTMYYIEADATAAATGNDDFGPNIQKTFWIADALARLLGGLLCSYLLQKIDGYLFAAITAFLSAAGFGVVFLAESLGSFWFYLSSILIGLSVGTWWVLVPQILLYDIGTRFFETLWGLTLSINVVGMFAFDMLFMLISGKSDPSKPSACTGYSWYLVTFVIAASAWVFAGIVCLFSFANNYEMKKREESINLVDLGTNKASEADVEARGKNRKSRVTFRFPSETKILPPKEKDRKRKRSKSKRLEEDTSEKINFAQDLERKEKKEKKEKKRRSKSSKKDKSHRRSELKDALPKQESKSESSEKASKKEAESKPKEKSRRDKSKAKSENRPVERSPSEHKISRKTDVGHREKL